MKTLIASSRIGIAPALLEAERLVEGDGPVDVADAVAGVDELHGPEGNVRRMIVERSMSPDWLSNTYLVAAAAETATPC